MSTPEEDLEKLIRTTGPGYHPDTHFYGYEPPITQYTRPQWNQIHLRFENLKTDPRDIYEFGLDIFNKMWEERKVERFPDGSRSDQVVMEEVEEQVSLLNNMGRDVLREVLNWSDAAQAALLKMLGE